MGFGLRDIGNAISKGGGDIANELGRAGGNVTGVARGAMDGMNSWDNLKGIPTMNQIGAMGESNAQANRVWGNPTIDKIFGYTPGGQLWGGINRKLFKYDPYGKHQRAKQAEQTKAGLLGKTAMMGAVGAGARGGAAYGVGANTSMDYLTEMTKQHDTVKAAQDAQSMQTLQMLFAALGYL